MSDCDYVAVGDNESEVLSGDMYRECGDCELYSIHESPTYTRDYFRSDGS